MTYTLVFRVTREVLDAMERGEKRTEYRDCKPFWNIRMDRAQRQLYKGGPVEALFLCGSREMRFVVMDIHHWDRHSTHRWEQEYLTTNEVWAVELGERIG